ncbi:hypothetical protein BDV96DRAFT_584783 [Lophiotrema nucula]|uniref:Condensation domain-containing protein n=1 Tax=Lophiotrema nucula TaxID=690887 RepID=A0A6A5YS05_9PLEO|nr:hypothetical protein BDV96DRAFT_584783 [Lophiotrema nucula]
MFQNPTLSVMALKMTQPIIETDLPITPFSLLQAHSHVGTLVTIAAQICGVSIDTIEDIYHCTPAQVYFTDVTRHLTDYEDGYKHLAEQFVYRVSVDCNTEKLQRAWNQVHKRHRMLRTRIVRVAQETFQVVVQEPIPWLFSDNLEAYLANDTQTTFGFGAQLGRFAFVADEVTGHNYFVMTLHHALYDGWMLSLLWADVKRVYLDVAEAVTPADYRAMIKHVDQIDDRVSLHFWREHLHGVSCKPAWALISSPTPAYSAAAAVTHWIPLMGIENGHPGVTLSTMIYGTLAVLLGSLSASPDVIFHLIRTGRDCSVISIEDMVAPVLTRHPLRVRVDGNQNLGQYFQGIQADLSSMIDAQFTSWRAIRQLSPEADMACKSAYLVNVVVLDEPIGVVERDIGLELERSRESTPPPVPFWIRLVVAASGIKATASYDPQAFDKRSIEVLMHEYEALLLNVMLSGPEKEVNDVRPILGR